MIRALRHACLAALLLSACNGEQHESEAGVGGSRDSCGAPGSHSEFIADHSCVCEDGYGWCSDAIDEFDCCPSGTDETGGESTPPDQPCDESLAEQLVCLSDGDPSTSQVWACNGERWVEVPGYATFACLDRGLPFAFGCAPGPEFLCGFGPGSTCEVAGYPGICVDEDIIDTCVWGRRTIDRCSRLCSELEAFGPGFATGACQQQGDESPATCVCG